MNILNEKEISDLDENLIGLNFSDPYFISLLNEIKGGKENETTLTSKEEKIKSIQESIKDEEFKKFLLEVVLCRVFVGGFHLLKCKNESISSSVSKINEECLNIEIKNNEFFKILRKYYLKNRWELPKFYNYSISELCEDLKNKLVYTLSHFVFEKYSNENFANAFRRHNLTCIIDCKNLHAQLVIQNNINCIFPSDLEWTQQQSEYLKSFCFQLQCRTLYLSFNLSIENWIVVFFDQLFSKLKKYKFFRLIRTIFFGSKTEQEEKLREILKETPELELFQNEIKNFLVKLKNIIKSSTHALFNIYKIEDSVFKDIFSEFAKKYGLEDSILHDNDPSDYIAELKQTVVLCFSYFFESTLNKYFGIDEKVIMKRTLIFEE
ncbi:hypothetical protein CWI38_0444p0020 [Hamiltosporidium tvaerminnensis]|uniref:Uncharacterized protein n=1 Tax=Hamiltosporidium tvaerminnensis TaxID=1176355 RepID=A0A4Q9LX94_9MICR|nr:hypothetical protein CWI38_0444p0020 [Hamiltosporidium tvaerminnensis]